MASKPRSEWSAAYRKRIESGERRGMSRQAARGKPPSEHVQRAAREVRKYGLEPWQRNALDKFARKHAYMAGSGDPDAAVRALREWAREQGYERFRELKGQIAGLRRDARAREKRGDRSTGASLGQIADDFDLPDMPDGDDLGWLFYNDVY
jgi:hypothetical protein